LASGGRRRRVLVEDAGTLSDILDVEREGLGVFAMNGNGQSN